MNWANPRELAGLIGLPGSERRTRDALTRMGIPSRPRGGREGGFEYAVEALPPAARLEWASRQKSQSAQKPHFKLHLDGRISLLTRKVTL
jgi:hypothetical protein